MNRKKIIKLGIFTLVAVSIWFTHSLISQSAQISSMAVITFNQEINVTGPDYEDVTLEQVNEIAKLDPVQSVEYHLGIELYNENLKLPHEDAKEKGMESMTVPLTQFMMNGMTHTQVSLLKEGVMSLKEGRIFNENELANITFEKVPILISEEFANINELSLGSVFILENRVYVIPLRNLDALDLRTVYVEDKMVAKETYEFEVIGIFTPNNIDPIHASILSNNLFVPESVVEEALSFNLNEEHKAHKQMYQTEVWWDDYEMEYKLLFQNQKASSPLFILKDSADWELFMKEANQILAPCHHVQRLKDVGDLASKSY